ncbi:MAG: hypothetical protein QOI24_139 [Acidobacteriota bacterium]|nr:hypothetical protein [Acidobacteriota bacterium]
MRSSAPPSASSRRGAKSVMIGDALQYVAGQLAGYSVDVPVAAQVTRASAAEPYLNFRIDLDAVKVAALSSKVCPHGLPPSRDNRALYIVQGDAPTIDAATRFLELMTRPEAGRRVGYMSASQFSREYGRFFGSAPAKHPLQLRRQAGERMT